MLDIVAVYRIDRFARKLKVLHEVTDYFEENDIEFVSVTENIDTSTPFGRAILSIIGVIAELEIETIKQRTQAGKKIAAKTGVYMGNAAVYGYKKTSEKKLELFSKEAEQVKNIFDLYANRKYGIGKIAKYLETHKVPSPEVSSIRNNKRKGTIQKQNSSFHWADHSIRRILQNEIYTGAYFYGKTKDGKKVPKEKWEKSDYQVPIIIDILTFTKTQELFKKSKHIKKTRITRPESYLLSGLLTCDNCCDYKKSTSRNHWSGIPKKVRSTGEYIYSYGCSRKNFSKYNVRCTSLPLPAIELEGYIVKMCLDLISKPLAVYEHQKKITSSKTEVIKLQKDENSLNKLILSTPRRKELLREQHEYGYLKTSELKTKMEEIESSERKYQIELSEIQESIARNSISEGYLKTLELFNVKYQKMLKSVSKNRDKVYDIIHMLIDEIVVYSRDKKATDKISGRKKDNQKIPYRISIRMKLPQDILREISKQEIIEEVYIGKKEKLSELTDSSSSCKNASSGR